MSYLPNNVLCATSTITDGNMSLRIGDTEHSLKNREQFLLKNGIDFNNHICMKCDHGGEITPIDWSMQDQYLGATTQREMLLSEVLVTKEKGLALMLLTADCLPVSFYDPVTETIALAHFSRETISKMLPQKTVRFLQEHFSINPKNLLVTVGPYIHTDSYSFELPQQDLPPALAPFIKKTETHTHIDLASACNHQLIQSGIILGNISTSDINTVASPQHFSHYQSKIQNIPDGRLATILMIR